jgi:type II secretory pathway predicted ATPase ExeA
MYEDYFGLDRSPFSMTPDPDMLFLTEGHREALAGLTYAIVKRKGFVVLEGEAGTGKTTLLRKLLRILPETQAYTSVVLNPMLSPAELLELLLVNFGIPDPPASKAQRLLVLEKLLRDAGQRGKAPALIVDEAHKLSHEVLEEIRLLTNFETDQSKLLQIVLTGQPELRDTLNRPELWQLKQRVAVRLTILPLTRAEISDYLTHRWTRARGSMPIPFSEEAITLIVKWSKGIPRLINSICDNALLLAFGDSSRMVRAGEILEAAVDLDLGGEKAKLSDPVGASNARLAVSQTRTGPPLPAQIKPIEQLKLGTLDRYMPPPEKGFLGFRWTTKPRIMSNSA